MLSTAFQTSCPRFFWPSKQNFRDTDLKFYYTMYCVIQLISLHLIFIKSVIFTEFTGLKLDVQDQGQIPEHTGY